MFLRDLRFAFSHREKYSFDGENFSFFKSWPNQHPKCFVRFFEFLFFFGEFSSFLLEKVIPFFEILAKPQYKQLSDIWVFEKKVAKLIFYREKSKNSKNRTKHFGCCFGHDLKKEKFLPRKEYFSLWEKANLKSNKMV